jgi:predicted AAA+ superfamily ATPase
LLDEIQKKTNFIKLGSANTNDFVKEYYVNLRSNVQLTTEEAIQKIKEISIKLIKGIDDQKMNLIIMWSKSQMKKQLI